MNNAGQIFNTYRCLFNSNTPLEKLPSLSFINTLRTNLENANKTTPNDGYIDAVSICLAQNGGIAVKEDSMISAIAENIVYYRYNSDLIYNNLSWNNDTLNKVVSYMIKHHIGDYLDIFKLMPKYTDLKSRYKVSDEELIGFFNDWNFEDEIHNKITNLSQLTNFIPDANFYKITASINNNLTKLINQTTIKILILSKTESNLIDTIGNYSGDYCHCIINALIENDCMKPIPNIINNFGGLVCERIANGNISVNDYTAKIISNIDGSKLTHKFSEIRDVYCNGKIKMDISRFKILEPNLRKYGRLNDRAADVIDKIIKPIIQDEKAKDIIMQNADFYKKLINSTDNIDDFKIQLRKSWSKEDVAKILGD